MHRAFFALLCAPILCVFQAAGAPGAAINACDVNQDGTVTVADVQRLISEVLGTAKAADDINRDGAVNVVDVQMVVDAALGLGCGSTGAPVLISASPSSGQAGATVQVVVNGQNTTFDATSQVSFGNGITVASVSVTSTSSLTVQIAIELDATLGTRTVTVTTGAQAVSLAAGFSVTPATIAVLASVSPSLGPVGVNQTVTITGVGSAFVQGQSVVNFGGNVTVQNVQVQSPTQLTANVLPAYAAAPGPRTVTVVTGVQTASSDNIFTVTGPPIVISSPSTQSFVNTPIVTVTGSVADPNAAVTVNSLATPNAGGNFSVSAPLSEGNNTVTVTARSAGSATSTATIQINLDTTPPHLAITSPPAGITTGDASVTVAGMVNDIVVGTVNDQEAQVTVNGIAAAVSNRSFSAVVPLALGANSIQVVARDRVGNAATASVSIQRTTTSQLRVVSGNNQSGLIQAQLPSPVVIEVRDALGAVVPNKTVVFRVTGNDGMVTPGTGAPSTSVVATANAQGQAQVSWTLGSRAGAGSNRLEVTSPGIVGVAVAVATGTSNSPGKIVVDSGLNQSGATGEALPLPLIAVVVDGGNNRLAGVPVTFTVRQGGGSLAAGAAQFSSPARMFLGNIRNGQPRPVAAIASAATTSVTVNTDGDGRASVFLTLGPAEGASNNLVDANFDGNAGLAAVFTATGLLPGNPSQTRVVGVVLDNSGQPIPGVTMRLLVLSQGSNGNLPVDVIPAVQTDSQGQFAMAQAPAGVLKLMADGTTVSGSKKYPTLEFDITTVTGRDSSINMPIYLKELDTVNQLCVTGSTGGTLTLPAAPGFALTVSPGSVTFPGGSRSGCLTVTPVNMDKIPMAPGFGQQPRFIVTIQPVGAKFDPPAALTIPNVDGLKPRAVTEMYSYDHDLGAFVAIGTGTVSDDGTAIKSDPGVGVLKAGWHCGGPPGQTGTTAECPDCFKCDGVECMFTPDQPCGQYPSCLRCKSNGPNSGACTLGVSPKLTPRKSQSTFYYDHPKAQVSIIVWHLLDPADCGAYLGTYSHEKVVKTMDTCNPPYTGLDQNPVSSPNVGQSEFHQPGIPDEWGAGVRLDQSCEVKTHQTVYWDGPPSYLATSIEFDVTRTWTLIELNKKAMIEITGPNGIYDCAIVEPDMDLGAILTPCSVH